MGSYHACNECHEMFGPFRPVDGHIMDIAYEDILEVIMTGLIRKDIKQQ